MLLYTMSNKEIIAEVKRDYEKLFETTIQRLAGEYDRERKKSGINRQRRYPRIYSVKTKAKNNWFIVLEKRPSVEKYQGIATIIFCAVAYYYDSVGLNVLHWSKDTGIVQSFYGHVFQRYNERMKLGIHLPIDVVKTFFNYNAHAHYKHLDKNDKCYMIGFTKHGFLFGEYFDEFNRITWKTFVARDVIRKDQDEIEQSVLDEFHKEIEEYLRKNEKVSADYLIRLDKLLGVRGDSIID
jgi:hypothetical protein